MNRSPLDREHDAGAHTDGGFTLIEVLISVVLLAMIMGALTTALLTSINLSSSTTQHTRDSNDAQLIAGYLVRDAQSAGATNSITGSVDAKYGITLASDAGCSVPSGDAPIVRFEWLDRTSAAQNYDDIAVYYYVPPASGKSGQVVRKTCGTSPDFASTNTLARNIPAKPTASCDPTPDCPGLPSTVSLTVSEVQHPTQPYTLTASTRAEGQPATPANATGAPAPLILLGDDNCSGTAPLSGNGNVPLKVFGNAFVEGGASDCHAYAVDNLTVTGNSEAIAPAQCAGAAGCTDIAGITARDPYASTLKAPPTGSDRSGCAGPGHYASFSVAVGDTCNLASGVYYVDNGFNVASGGTVNADDGGVLIYLAGGQFSIDGKFNASSLTAPQYEQYDGVVLWQPAGNTQPLNIGAAANVHLNGVVYAPGGALNVARRVAMKAFVGKSLNFASAPNPDTSYDVSQIGLITPTETSMTTGTPSKLPPILDQAATNEMITINGSNFQPGATVSFFGAGITEDPNSLQVVSANKITVVVSVADSATLGAGDVVITNPDGGVDIEDGALTIEPRPAIKSVTLANGAGPPNNGVIEAGDTITVVFSKLMRESSVCKAPAWAGDDTTPQKLAADGDVIVSVNDGGVGGDDSIDITSAAGCGPPGASFGHIELGGADYVTTDEMFAGAGLGASTITWTGDANANTSTMQITLGTETPPRLPVPPALTIVPAVPSAPTYTVPPRFTDNRGTNGGLVTPPTFTIAPPAQQF